MALPLSNVERFLSIYDPESATTGANADRASALFVLIETVIGTVLKFAQYGGTVEEQEYTLRLDGEGEPVLYLPIPNVTEITSVHSDRTWAFGSSTEITDYELDTQGGGCSLHRPPTSEESDSNVFQAGDRATKVVCTAGWTSATWPLESAVFMWAGPIYQTSRNVDATALNTGAYSTSMQKVITVAGMPQTVAAMVGRYIAQL